MKKTVLFLMMITVFSKILGFGREISLSYFYGTSYISDSYIISTTIPATIFSIVGMGLVTSYIPMYSKILNEKSVAEADRFTNNIINFVLIISTLMIIGTQLFTIPIVKLFASGFQGETLYLATRFTKITIFCIYFTGLIYLYSGYLQIKNSYAVPALLGIPLNLFIIFSISISHTYGNTILAFGFIVATITQLLFLIPFIYKKGYQYRLVLDIHDDNLKKMIFLAVPVILGVAVNQVNILVDKTIASQIVVGGISALNYANRLNLFIQGIFVESIAIVLYPVISKMATENDVSGLKKTVSEAIAGINLLVIPATIGAMIFAEPIVKLLFGRGAFDSQAITMTSSALFFYSIGMIGYGLREIISKAFYALQDTKTPMINAAIAVVINIILNLILSKFMGISGLALATSISAIFCTALLFVNLYKKIGSFGIKNISISFVKVLFASLLMGVQAKLSYNILQNYISTNLSLIFSIAMGTIVYFIIIHFMKIEEVDMIISSVKKRMKISARN
jgi:putative peptidoglycan lipid II flippase